MRQIRLALVMVWLAGCGSSNTTSVDAPSSTPDSPTSGGADAPRPADARVADSPTGGSADAPAATPDAPVETPDAPVETPDAPDVTPDASTGLCGNGVVDPGESCDTAINSGEGACPTSCTDSDVDLCTAAVLTGAGTCEAACMTQAVAATNGDGLCCPPATSANDNDCGNAGFRITSLVLEDPHVWTELLGGGCSDQTATVNGAIDGDLNGDGDHDNNLDLSPVVLFKPLDNNAGDTTPINLVFATCTAPADTSTCSATGSTTRFTATATNSAADASAACLDVIDGTHNDNYDDIVTPQPACLNAPFGQVTLHVPVSVPFGGNMIPGTLVLVLEDVDAASTYLPSGSAANDKLVSGELRGFLTEESAKSGGTSFLDLGFAQLALSTFLAGGTGNCVAVSGAAFSDRDKHNSGDDAPNGWWFYLSFEAVKVPYAEAP